MIPLLLPLPCPRRPDLKVVLMSATLDAQAISEYFGGCATISIPGAMHPVSCAVLHHDMNWTMTQSATHTQPPQLHHLQCTASPQGITSLPLTDAPTLFHMHTSLTLTVEYHPSPYPTHCLSLSHP